MKYYLGIDGGGTKTTYTVIDETNKVVSVTRSQGSAIDTYPIKDVEKTLIKAIDALPYKFSGIFAGLGGISCDKDILVVNKILAKAKNAKGAKVGSNNDVANALKGTIPEGNGIVLIAGTGSVAYGVNGKIAHRAGGYGYQEGDAGSAYALGKDAIEYLARVMDKRLPETGFARALEDATKCYQWYELAKWVGSVDRADIAQLAVVVTSYSKNKFAKAILDKNIAELKLAVDTCYKACKFKGKAKFAIVGSLGTAETYYKQELLKGLGNKKYDYQHDKHDAGMGAVLLAKDLTK